MDASRDDYWMQQALILAREARKAGEVPVGALVVLNDELVAAGFNYPINSHDASAHAEMVAIRAAGQKLNNYRLLDTTLYVTLEPCLMCAGAMVHARIKRLVFGAYDAKSGVICSCQNALDLPFLNHRVTYTGGIMAEVCGEELSSFFRERRATQ